MLVFARKNGIDYPLMELREADYKDAIKRHPGLIGIPQYWMPGKNGPKVWPKPEADIEIRTEGGI